MPISYTQDAVGPITRNIHDLAAALTVMASVGFDAEDNTTTLVTASSVGIDYTQAIAGGGTLHGVRFGLVEGFFNRTASNETTPVNKAMNATVESLTNAGATVVPIQAPIFNSAAIIKLYDTQRFEYRQEMDAYLSRPSLAGSHPAALIELYDSGKFLVIPSQYEYVNTALVSSTDNATYAARKLGIANLTLALHVTFKRNALDAL